MSFGVMGGQYQPIGQAHVLQNIFEFGMSIQEAIDLQRAFALNGKLKIEKSFSETLVKELKNLVMIFKFQKMVLVEDKV